MKLTILGSSSAGNCYILHNETEALIIEAGIKFDFVKRELDYNLTKVRACLISHEHGDHASQAADFIDSCIPTYASKGTIDSIGIESSFMHRCEARKQFSVGRFDVLPFATKHDAVEPLGFIINHPETGMILFASDTYYLPFRFPGLSHMLIECNYIESILKARVEAGKLPEVVAERVHQSHMEIETCIDALRANDMSKMRNIILIHISQGNGDPVTMRRRAIEATGKNVGVAEAGLTININKEAF